MTEEPKAKPVSEIPKNFGASNLPAFTPKPVTAPKPSPPTETKPPSKIGGGIS
jgi:hypothetical protein